MRLESKKWLADILDAAKNVLAFTHGRRIEDYSTDAMMRAAVERKFSIMGEAMNRLRREDPETAARITAGREIIAFRNLLVHGYDEVDDAVVWDVIQNEVPRLLGEVEVLLRESTDPA